MIEANIEEKIVDSPSWQSRLAEFTKKLPDAIKRIIKDQPIHAKITNKSRIISPYTTLVSTIEFCTDDGRCEELHIAMVDRTRYSEHDTVLYHIIHGSSGSGFEICYSDDTDDLDPLINDVLPDILQTIIMKRFSIKN